MAKDVITFATRWDGDAYELGIYVNDEWRGVAPLCMWNESWEKNEEEIKQFCVEVTSALLEAEAEAKKELGGFFGPKEEFSKEVPGEPEMTKRYMNLAVSSLARYLKEAIGDGAHMLRQGMSLLGDDDAKAHVQNAQHQAIQRLLDEMADTIKWATICRRMRVAFDL